MAGWSFLTNHARAILYVAGHPDARIRELAAAIGVTERTAFALLDDLTRDGFVVKERQGRRNRYHVQADQPIGEPLSAERAVGELLDLLVRADTWTENRRAGRPAYSGPDRRQRSP